MNIKTLKFNNIKLNENEFHKSKELTDLFSVELDQIAVSDRFKHNDSGFKYFIGYQKGDIVNPISPRVFHCPFRTGGRGGGHKVPNTHNF